ncbi:response regulator transcription factor [Rossellomorea sp. YZS02]|uniref:response regulator transcription factor n=1 Tax=Rossellomorea sp. YZS02 TaxID=3097358 RepID=UPI002A0FA0AF|nr:response regulator transcription factor [Rossellomorea sp. YZS02]MDX8344254.1 response regulator transcription factor [Rossellomorea sp. YZS02]
MAKKVLLVDDEENIVDVCSRYLIREGFDVSTASNGIEAIKGYHSFNPDIVILDIMMPEMDGWQVAEKIREDHDTPIIMLTALGQEKDRIYGLTIGADDYVTKPFSPRELLLRVKNVLRRTYSAAAEEQQDVLKWMDLQIDRNKRTVVSHGFEVEMTVKEFELLSLLAQHPSQVFSKSQLIETLWGYEYMGDANTINVHIRRLREKIEKDPSEPRWIKTVWGIGYKFEGEHHDED